MGTARMPTHEADGRAGGGAFEDAGENPHLVGFAPLGRVFRLARAAPVQVPLQIRFGERQPRRAAVHHRAQRRAVALAKGGDRERLSEGVARHASEAYRVSLRSNPTQGVRQPQPKRSAPPRRYRRPGVERLPKAPCSSSAKPITGERGGA